MTAYNKREIINKVEKCLAEGMNNDDVQDIFLMMKMLNDLGNKYFKVNVPSLASVNMNLIGNGVIAEKDFTLKDLNAGNQLEQSLEVRLSPSRTLRIVKTRYALTGTVNNNPRGMQPLGNHDEGEMALWIIRQKQNLELYLQEWESVLKSASKKMKNHRMASLAIKAIFSEAMKDSPDVKYLYVEQKRRIRIKVWFPDSKLGVIIDAWWGSYRQRLPKQIEDLKKLLEVHKNVKGITYFVS